MTQPATPDKGKIARLCQQFGVRRLFLFGSAARDALSDSRDIDFLVDFEAPAYRDTPTDFSA